MHALATPSPARDHLPFITLLRASAALLVLWSHLVGGWFYLNKGSWLPFDFVEANVNRPLGIVEFFGHFGVCLFFLVSGFIITHVAQREDRLTFGVKRVLRIYPVLIASVFAFPLIGTYWSAWIGFPNQFTNVTNRLLFHSCTLLNFYSDRYWAINLAAWTLAIEMLFYGLCLILLPLIQRRPRTAISIELAFVAFFIGLTRSTGKVQYFSENVIFIPCLLIGQTMYFLRAGRISFRSAALFCAAAYLLYIQGRGITRPDRAALEYERISSFVFAWLIFVIVMQSNHRLRLPRWINWTADISYSMYLFHSMIAFPIMFTLHNRTPYELNLAVAVFAVLLVSYLSCRFIERPTQSLARWLLAFRNRQPTILQLPAAATQHRAAA